MFTAVTAGSFAQHTVLSNFHFFKFVFGGKSSKLWCLLSMIMIFPITRSSLVNYCEGHLS
jgi:hypothetical protein